MARIEFGERTNDSFDRATINNFCIFRIEWHTFILSERQATEKCEAAAAERKLAGAAKNSNVKKCVKDAVGE